MKEKQICDDCGEALEKAYVELDDGTWRAVWLCGCDIPEDTTGIVPFNTDRALGDAG